MATIQTERTQHVDPAIGVGPPEPVEPVDRGPSVAALPKLLRELRDEAALLARQEFDLARAELSEKVQSTQRKLAASATGAVFLLAGIITLCFALTALLYAGLLAMDVSPAVSSWLAPLIVGFTVSIIGAVMVSRAKKLTTAEHWRPRHTERSVRETKAWAERKV